MKQITFQPIGKIRSEFKTVEGTPIQPTGAEGIEGKIELMPEFEEGLIDLKDFSHLILLYHCHLAGRCSLKNKPFLEDKEHGIFAIRAPSRPNSIGLSVVRLKKIEKNIIYIKDVDIVDDTPLLDIKPYVSEFDIRKDVKTGWYEKNVHKLSEKKDDGRFS
ncbi:MAG: tRNA (N6-threonylcarbamoyladenosine(37)-N6)-methyltransferase TrmO [Halanaerobium sp.]